MTSLAAVVLLAHSALSADLDLILSSPALSGATLGVCVTRMDGSIVYERDGMRTLVPASCQKAFTVALCLDRLGSGYEPQTKIWKTDYGAFVDAPGDPGLTSAQLREIGGQLALPKDSVIRVREAYRPGFGPGWEWDDLPFDYAAKVAAFSVDRCTFVVRAEAGKMLPLDPALRVSARRGSTKGGVRVQYDPTRAALTISGALPKSLTDIEELAQPDPSAYAARLLGGKFEASQDEPPARTPDHVLQGAPIWALAKECAEDSVNPLAEHFLFMGTGAATYPGATSAMRSFLVDEVRVSPGSVVPADGSGLSRRNRASARALCRLFEWANESGKLSELEDALAACGEGTLKTRLSGSSFVGKTGTMRGIVGLCGTLTTANGTKLAMAFLVNGSSGTASRVRVAQDEFVRALEANVGGGGPLEGLVAVPGVGLAGYGRDD
ncbi:MAG: D-alanyl-D-alanine carboxypeptidase/D-alanyl-D-alanine-endopeptidase [Fimbriimonadaceae bacterium]